MIVTMKYLTAKQKAEELGENSSEKKYYW